MIKIIDIVDNKIIIAPECLVIEPFKSIWEKDKTDNKLESTNSIKYIWFYCDFKSPFYQHSQEDKHSLIISHVIKDKGFKVNKEVQEGIKTYEKINTTPSMKLFNALQESITKMEIFFKNAEYNEDSITKIQKAIIDMPKMQEAVQAALNNCIKEQGSGDRVRGDKKLGIFENK